MSPKLEKWLYFIVLWLVFSGYFILNRFLTPAYMFETSIDRAIPFTPIFSLAYTSYFVLVVIGVSYSFIHGSVKHYKGMTYALILAQIIAYITYILIPSYIRRPPLGASIFDSIVGLIYYYDNPTNLTPSLHVANSIIISSFMRTSRYWIYIAIWALLIILSTAIIKQHYVIDVISGLGLGIIASKLGNMERTNGLS